MSRAFEALLADKLARLEQWIAESESLASRTDDEETLGCLERDLGRWREERVECELRLGRTKSLNRIVFWAHAAFWISYAALMSIAFVGVRGGILALLVAVDILLLIGCGAAYVIAIILRDAVARGRRPWQFSLLALLVGMTVIAVVLGLSAYMLRE